MQHHGVERAISHVFNWHKIVNLVARNRDVIEIMRVIPLFIPLHEHAPQNERWGKRLLLFSQMAFSPLDLDFSKYGWYLNRFSRCVCVCVCGFNYIGFLLYTLTLECTLVSVKDVGGTLHRRILRGDERFIQNL